MTKNVSLIVLIILFSFGCMKMDGKMGGGMGKPMASPMKTKSPEKGKADNTDQIMGRLIDEAVADLSTSDLSIGTIAVWRINAQSDELHVELLTQQLIESLVNLGSFKVVSREKLSELLEEQSLSLTGAMDDKNAVEIGSLIGVGAFVDGYAAVEDNQVTLSLSLIDTKTGVIIWAKTVTGPLR